jgi:serine/threonine protein kinase
MRINTKKRPFLSSDVDELIVPHVVDNEIFFLTKRYTLQHVIERNINCAYWYVFSVVNTNQHSTGTIRTGSCSEKVLIRKVKNVFSEAKLRTNESEQLELQMRLLRELELLRFAQHENVVKLIDTPAPTSLQTLKDVYIVSELPDTDLYSLLAFPRAKFDDKRIQSFIYQTLCALQYLHSAGIIHGYVVYSSC